MPKIEIEDGVMNVEGYEGVRTKFEFITQFNIGLGGLLAIIGFFNPEGFLLKIGLIVCAVGIGSLFITRSVILQISKNGSWQELGKFTYPKAEKIKEQLISELKN